MMDTKDKKLLLKIPLEVLLTAALFLIALFVFAYIAHDAMYGQEDSFDAQVHTYLLAHSTPALISVAEDVTFLGSAYFLLPAYVLLIAGLLIYKRKRNAIAVSIVAVSSFLLMHALKQIFHRNRPDLPIIKGITTYSFPSGHTLSSFIFCSVLAYLAWSAKWHPVCKWLLTVLLLLLAIGIGMSRIVLNVHFATDVIAGFCLGVIWVILSFWIMQKINKHQLVKQ